MRYLVTGGAGFIGSNIVDELLRRGQSVLVLDDLSTGKKENLAADGAVAEFQQGSICDFESVRSMCRGMDYVIHLAAQTSVPLSIKQPLETNRVNVDGTLHVFEAARQARVKRVVFAGSSAIYGETPTLPKEETMTPAPISPYGVAKFVNELYGQVFGRVYGLENVSLRYFNVFGPRQEPSSPYSGVLSKFMLAMLRGEPLVIFGDGEQSRDFTYITNVVDATLRACEAPGVSGMAFNVGTGSRITLNQVVQSLGRITGRELRVKYDPPRAGDILHSQASVERARKHLGYAPTVGLEEGLRRTWDWYKGTYSK
jgi:nucleoside-diphosphate-sugar epimerase